MNREVVGRCKSCGKEIVCRDGFLEGVVDQYKDLICFSCEKENGLQSEDRRRPS